MALTKPRQGGPSKSPDSLQWLVDAYTKNTMAKSSFVPSYKSKTAPTLTDPNQRGQGILSESDLSPAGTQFTSTNKVKPDGKFVFETKQPGTGDGTRSGNKGNVDLVNVGAQSLKYLVPTARLLSNEKHLKDLRSKSQLNLDKVHMMYGKVQDLQRPNFAMRYRDPAGSSLQELIGGQKFDDAQQRQAERDWQLQNSTSRIQQQQAVNQNMNQENSINTQITNAGKQYNTNIANNERFMRMGNQEELELGLTETALNDVNQKNYLDATKEASAAADILRYGQPGTDEYNQAQKYYMGVVGRNKSQTPIKEFGGKLKRKTKLSYAS